MDELAQSAMDAVTDGRVRIHPERYAKGYLDWLSEKRDWPIGRQLWWGHRIPVWSQVISGTYENGATSSPNANSPHPNPLPKGEGTGLGFLSREEHSFVCVQDSINDSGSTRRYICVKQENAAIEEKLAANGYVQESDVLDTWFSSALWPHSTLGWPEQTPELKYYYPTSVLITSRDIITLWVARMVLTGLHNIGEVPFRDVFIHPKILDGFGEGMSKSKGNGVDPVDVMEKFGADSLRFGLAYLTTETQDVRMAVEFECPHCQKLIEQTKENRTKPRIKCKHCGESFSTQWAEKPEDKALPRGAVVSDRFELARNFCNKLWNASRFAMMNLEGFNAGVVADEELCVEDSWVLSRLATVTGQVTDALDQYRFADAARTLYDFAWDEFCSFYVEMVKGRLQDDLQRMTAQRVLAHTLDTILRLLHPMIPFLTEDVWHLLNEVVPERGIDKVEEASESIMRAPWPEADPARQDAEIEAQFARFQEVLRAVRDIRARQGVAPKVQLKFVVRCESDVAELLRPMASYFDAMANAVALDFGPNVVTPALTAHVTLTGMDVYVDLAELIDVPAEIARKKQEIEKLAGFIAAKEKKLSNETFVQRAPADVVQKERDGLKDLQDQLTAAEDVLKRLAAKK
jgi:valyl-tRNA synthetase